MPLRPASPVWPIPTMSGRKPSAAILPLSRIARPQPGFGLQGSEIAKLRKDFYIGDEFSTVAVFRNVTHDCFRVSLRDLGVDLRWHPELLFIDSYRTIVDRDHGSSEDGWKVERLTEKAYHPE